MLLRQDDRSVVKIALEEIPSECEQKQFSQKASFARKRIALSDLTEFFPKPKHEWMKISQINTKQSITKKTVDSECWKACTRWEYHNYRFLLIIVKRTIKVSSTNISEPSATPCNDRERGYEIHIELKQCQNSLIKPFQEFHLGDSNRRSKHRWPRSSNLIENRE